MNIIEAKFLTDLFLPLQSDILNITFVFITTMFNNGYFPIAIGLILLFIPKYRYTGLRIILSLFIGLVIGNLILKPVVARTRPYEYLDISLIIPKPTDFSFPSGHTQAAFALASSIFITNRKIGLFMYFLAIFVALSRLYLMVHYPTDVIFGMLLGISYGYIANRLINTLRKFKC